MFVSSKIYIYIYIWERCKLYRNVINIKLKLFFERNIKLKIEMVDSFCDNLFYKRGYDTMKVLYSII